MDLIFFELDQRNIRLHWLRSLLAVLGIIIGVMAISSMGSWATVRSLYLRESHLHRRHGRCLSAHHIPGAWGRRDNRE